MFDQLMRVSRGFKLVFIGLLIVIIAVIAIIGASLVFGAAAARGRIAGAGLGLFGGGVIVLVVLVYAGNVIGLIGRFFCISIPERAGQAKQFIIISIVLEVISMVLTGFSQLGGIAQLDINPILMQVLPLAQLVCQLGSGVFILVFTKAVAQYIRQEYLGDTAMSVLKMFVMSIACYILGILLIVGLGLAGAVAGGGAGGVRGAAGGFMLGACLGAISMLVGFIIVIIALIRFIALMKEMSEAVARYARVQRRKQREKRESDRRRRDEDDEEEEEEEEDDDDDRRRRRRGREKWSD